MKTQNEFEKNITKDIHIKLLQDTLGDLRTENRFIKKVVIILFIILTLAIAGIIAQGMYHHHKLFTFLQDYETVSDVKMDNMDSYNNGNIIIKR